MHEANSPVHPRLPEGVVQLLERAQRGLVGGERLDQLIQVVQLAGQPVLCLRCLGLLSPREEQLDRVLVPVRGFGVRVACRRRATCVEGIADRALGVPRCEEVPRQLGGDQGLARPQRFKYVAYPPV
jgi:hypothetical protein